MVDREAEALTGRHRLGHARSRRGDFALDGVTKESQAGISLQRPGEQLGLGQDLEAVADAEDGPAGGSEPVNGFHDG